MTRGNVRTDSLASIYRDDPVFRGLRDADALEGKCGACEFRTTCGGSRSRAYAASGSVLGADPLCAYVPSGYVNQAGPRVDLGAGRAGRTIPLHPVAVATT